MTGVFVICALVLMGSQDHRAVGIEWLVIAAVSAAIYTHGYVQAVRLFGSVAWLRLGRAVVLGVLYTAQLVGAAFLVADHIAGLYVAAVAMTAALAFMISAAWLLVVGWGGSRAERPGQEPITAERYGASCLPSSFLRVGAGRSATTLENAPRAGDLGHPDT